MSGKKIAFWVNQMSVRGTEIANYDYAHHNEVLLGNRSIVIYNASNPHNIPDVTRKFQDRFELRAYEDFSQVDRILKEEQVDLFYVLKAGVRDNIISTLVPSLVHAVFPTQSVDFHGDSFAFVSHWLSKVCSNGKVPAVPHMVQLPSVEGDLRSSLSIPEDARVFACYGGGDSFDIKFVKETVIPRVLETCSDVFFLFMNINPFLDHPRVIFLPGCADLPTKVRFINTSDAMLHARKLGESFGLACAEFSICNKPVFTYGRSSERNHLMVLGPKARVYSGPRSLYTMIKSFDSQKAAMEDWDAYSKLFHPDVVMTKFDQELIQPALLGRGIDGLYLAMRDRMAVRGYRLFDRALKWTRRVSW